MPLIEIGVLWVPPRGSKAELTGKLGNARCVILPNDYKEEDKHPDFRIFVASDDKDRDDDRGERRKTRSRSRSRKSKKTDRDEPDDDDDDDLPF